MLQEIQDQSFLEGFVIGELTGRLKHQAPSQVDEWISLDKIEDFKSVFRKYNYSITGLSAHPSDTNQILITATKIDEGTNSREILAFGKDDNFMDGWHVGYITGMMRYDQPNQWEEWVKLTNLRAIERVMDEYGYVITALRNHPENQNWTLLTAQRKSSD